MHTNIPGACLNSSHINKSLVEMFNGLISLGCILKSNERKLAKDAFFGVLQAAVCDCSIFTEMPFQPIFCYLK